MSTPFSKNFEFCAGGACRPYFFRFLRQTAKPAAAAAITSTSFGAKLLAALRNGWTGFVSGAQAVAVFLVGAWPAILIGAVCGVIYYRVRHPRKKK